MYGDSIDVLLLIKTTGVCVPLTYFQELRKTYLWTNFSLTLSLCCFWGLQEDMGNILTRGRWPLQPATPKSAFALDVLACIRNS